MHKLLETDLLLKNKTALTVVKCHRLCYRLQKLAYSGEPGAKWALQRI